MQPASSGSAWALLLRRRGPSLEGAVGVLEDGDELLEIGLRSPLGREESAEEISILVANKAFGDVLVGITTSEPASAARAG